MKLSKLLKITRPWYEIGIVDTDFRIISELKPCDTVKDKDLLKRTVIDYTIVSTTTILVRLE